MKEIGESLKEARENIGLSLEEAAGDLKMTPDQLSEIEEGNLTAFKDVLSLKYFIRDYSKYLGLDYETMIDEFNEYLFDYTSKISLEDIRRAAKKAEANSKKEEKRIASPYTMERKKKIKIPMFVWYIMIVGLILAVFFFVYQQLIVNNDNKNTDNVIATTSLGG